MIPLPHSGLGVPKGFDQNSEARQAISIVAGDERDLFDRE